MSATNHTQYYNLPQFADSDIPTWGDVNAAFLAIDTALHTIAESAGISSAQAQALIDASLVGTVFHDANNTGITSAQYSKLGIKPSV